VAMAHGFRGRRGWSRWLAAHPKVVGTCGVAPHESRNGVERCCSRPLTRSLATLLLQVEAMVNMEWPPCKRKVVGSTPTTGSHKPLICSYGRFWDLERENISGRRRPVVSQLSSQGCRTGSNGSDQVLRLDQLHVGAPAERCVRRTSRVLSRRCRGDRTRCRAIGGRKRHRLVHAGPAAWVPGRFDVQACTAAARSRNSISSRATVCARSADGPSLLTSASCISARTSVKNSSITS
jgi:hypothetical protein